MERIIHYCWFGPNKKSFRIKKCIKSWKKFCPDYEIIEWNEQTFDLSLAPIYVQQAYQRQKWAFVTDYVRLFACYNYGGFYFDTDVELIKPLTDFENSKGFFCFEDDSNIATGLGFASEKGEKLILDLMQEYNNISFINKDGSLDLTPCPIRNAPVFLSYGLQQNGESQTLSNGIQVLNKSWFAPLNWKTGKMEFFSEKTHGIHHYLASWHNPQQRWNSFKNRIKINFPVIYKTVKMLKGK